MTDQAPTRGYVTFVASTDKPGDVVVKAYADGVLVLSRPMGWKTANNLIGDIHAACREASAMEAGQ
jgi:hypothetical protein